MRNVRHQNADVWQVRRDGAIVRRVRRDGAILRSVRREWAVMRRVRGHPPVVRQVDRDRRDVRVSSDSSAWPTATKALIEPIREPADSADVDKTSQTLGI